MNDSSCRGGGYWIGGVKFTTRENFAKGLNEREGFKSSNKLMKQWLDNQKPYKIEQRSSYKINPYIFLDLILFNRYIYTSH